MMPLTSDHGTWRLVPAPIGVPAARAPEANDAIEIASLTVSTGFDRFVMSSTGDGRMQVSAFRDLGSLLTAMRHREFAAVIVEDEPRELSYWLGALRMRVRSSIPIVVFGNGGAGAISRALAGGASDYSTHSEGPETLLHRLRARLMLRRAQDRAQRLNVGGVQLDAESQSLRCGSIEVGLTAREFALAWSLFENHDRVVSFHTLSAEIWGRASDIGKRTIEQHVYKLRRKLSQAEGQFDANVAIQTVYGVGYRLRVQSAGLSDGVD